MAGPSPGTYGEDGSSSSSQAHGQNVFSDLDGDEAADLGQENALLAEDPLDDEFERTP